ncbi:MAG TPA: sulfotransferase family 2 domain-containing protein, partial [Gemmataceae bacterium]|nr:sulfotransferase family 2 domain-containing protein [Gemmataceae bacterium]
MLCYSHWHRFVFVHVAKAAGVSVRQALGRFADRSLWRRVKRRLGWDAFSPLAALPAHATAVQVQRALPEEAFQRYFKFAFVRNPWDWQVSWYHFLRQTLSHPLHAVASRMRDFEEFLMWRLENDRQLQKSFVTDPQGRLLVDFLGRFENLEQDFRMACSRIGLRVRLPHCNRSRHRDYRWYYTDRTRELVELAWAED